MTQITTTECIEWIKIVQTPAPYQKGEKYRSAIRAKLLAAQEMAKALEKAMSWIDNWSPSFCEDEEWHIDEPKIKAAIAAWRKAGGQ